MGNALYEKGREGFLDGSIDWDTNTIKAALCDLATEDTGNQNIESSTNATPIVVTITSHGWSNGDYVMIQGHLTNTNANGYRKIKNVAANTFELTDTSDVNIAGNGVGGATGQVANLGPSASGDNWDDVSASVIGTPQTLTSPTVASGVADAADVTYTSVSGASIEAIIIYKDTGTQSTSRLIAYIDSATGLPLTPNGGDITVQWDNGANRIFKL